MTNAQTEARALWLAATREEICNDGDAISVIATALAAKDAELEEMRSKCQALDDECQQSMLDIARERDRAERAEAALAEARKAMNYLNDAVAVGLSDQEVSRRAKLLFAARRALEAQGGE